MRRSNVFLSFLMVSVLIILVALAANSPVSARDKLQDEIKIARGGQLYDQWSAVLVDKTVPPGNQPIWSRQSMNTRSGADTWRCVSCHGWDYQGTDGAISGTANDTGFSGILDAANQTKEEIENQIGGKNDPQHDFSTFFDQEDIDDLTAFIQDGLIDDNQYIDLVTRKVINGDVQNGKSKYENACASCHGEDGTGLTFRYEGTEIALGTLAVQDPWRFLHRTRFGTARAPEMAVGINLGWTPQDGRDVVFYAQSSLKSGFENIEGTPAVIAPVENKGGPAKNIFSGILTAFGAMATSLGFAVLLGAALVGIILLLVWLLRSRES